MRSAPPTARWMMAIKSPQYRCVRKLTWNSKIDIGKIKFLLQNERAYQTTNSLKGEHVIRIPILVLVLHHVSNIFRFYSFSFAECSLLRFFNQLQINFSNAMALQDHLTFLFNPLVAGHIMEYVWKGKVDSWLLSLTNVLYKIYVLFVRMLWSHYGESIKRGHYTAVAKDSDNRWWMLNDDVVFTKDWDDNLNLGW